MPKRRLLREGGVLIAATLAWPASAQIAGNLAVQSDDRDRGYSVSDGKPAATLGLSYDQSSGIYLNGSASAIVSGGNPVLLAAVGNIGYARRIDPRVSIDGGYAHTQYSRYAAVVPNGGGYDEVYVGVSAYGLSSHIYVSPDYYRRDVSVVYAELDAASEPVVNWRLAGHIGVLTYLSEPRQRSYPARYDWRLAISRPIRRFDISVALASARRPNDDGAVYHEPNGAVVTGGISWTF